jgi:hypothetical protein
MSDLSPHACAITPADAGDVPDLPRETLAAFVQTLAQWGNVRAAAQQVGVSRAHLYRVRRASPEFRQLWDAALVLARPQVEEVLADRALNGVQETVFYHGEEVATRTRYDGRLLLAHLARLDRIESTNQIYKVAAEFEERVALLLDPPEVMDWDDEDYEEYDEDDGAEGDEGEAAEGDDAAFEDRDAFIARLRGNTP